MADAFQAGAFQESPAFQVGTPAPPAPVVFIDNSSEVIATATLAGTMRAAIFRHRR